MSDDRDDELTPHQTRVATGETPLDLRQQLRLPADYTAGAVLPFDPRLPFELALGMAIPREVFAKYGYEPDAAIALAKHPLFQQALARYKEDLAKDGASFKLKARIQAEDLLQHSYDLATDSECPPSVRADLIKWTAAVAGLGPVTGVQKGEGASAGGAEFNLNITFSGPGPARVAAAQGTTIDVTPTAKELSA